MARYMGIAADAGKIIRELLAQVPADQQPDFAVQLAKVYNLGIRTSPRAVQSTVRRNAVTEAMRGLPVRVSMVPVAKRSGVGTFNALQLVPIGGSNIPATEGDSDDD